MTLQEKLEALRDRAKAAPPVEDLDAAYEELRKKHYGLYHYIKFEAPVPFCPIETLRNLKLLGLDFTTKRFAERLLRDVKKLYGDDYPR